MAQNNSQPKRGSVRVNGKWVSIPIGTPNRPLTDAEVAEAKTTIERAEGEKP